ncbi:DNA polymerase alpha catalytic subunit [Gracilariopsis chorda]|uniref:DNA-directed DNA polymerase n=1 Tax=Gracilariopsis chorda TaxID=448386 RepID=A0A2V3IVX1_9FLOR|nr:DNA polymerase alpha catalytic subunit [Gracilariopsis chorda]|eukprot:PXF45857.1 DNA polymerase alpha catalytic subunit [Gracilariopsis chorda]
MRGLYDRYVLLLDFNSLYLSVIHGFNICFTTLHLNENRNQDGSSKNGDVPLAPGNDTDDVQDILPGMLPLPNRSVPERMLPRFIQGLVEQRKQVKKLLKEEKQRSGRETLRAQQLDIRHLAIWLTANSLYECLGFEGGRFYARSLAAMVNCEGRDTLQKTVDFARDAFNAKVIYGDTNSFFVSIGMESIELVRKLDTELKRDVN